MSLYIYIYIYIYMFLLSFCGENSQFYGATGILCFRLWLILPVGFKARVDPSSPALCSRLCVMILRVDPSLPALCSHLCVMILGVDPSSPRSTLTCV